MNFKIFLKTFILVITIWFTIPAQSATVAAIPLRDSTADLRVLTAITNRLAEIQNMDKTQLTVNDRKALTKELKEMKKTADDLNKRVYISIGAIIIIILLLILLLK